MGQSPSSSAKDQEVTKGTQGKGSSSSLLSEHELEELNQTFRKICQPNKVEDGFTLPQLQGFIGGKLPSSIVLKLHKEMKAKNIPDEIKISRNAFVMTMGCLMNGTVDQQSGLMFSLFADEGTNAVSVGHLSKLIGSLLQSYEEALKTCNQMKNWDLVCTPESNKNFIDLVMRMFSAGGKTTGSPVSKEEFERWLQQTPLMQKVFTALFHLCFVDTSKTPAAAASSDDCSDSSVLFHMPCLPACLDIDWRRVRSQLHIPTLLILNHHLPRHLQDQWRFCFSSNLHGASFATLLSHIKNKGPTVVLVRDTDGNVFGGFASQSWELGPSFVGSSSCFLFSLAPKVGFHEPSGQNDHYMYLNIDQQTLPNGLGMGGQFDYFGLWINQEFGEGHSRARPKCTTYDSPQLSSKEDFTIETVEVWAVGPLPKKPQEEDEDEKKSVLDKNPEAQALLELIGKERKSEGLREEDPTADIPAIHEMPTR
ncbi:MTOR-associated protein MEAK7-like [Asterias rubens]|uniref:MTOR-associated protein MEAK7-like n=1 Tax=Asterias rubens TaxID=7604 RepID=UPI001455A8E8|nr:MTOR-associated protein MEAK7-like [Asterias rubens]XP_033626741.1 MTOR-associated protein MEAK7-like [Asterias rubens]